MKFISFSDVHISSVNPSSRVGSYQSDIMDKILQVGAAGKKLGVDFYLFAGDLFNLKAPMKNPHGLNRMLIEAFKSFGAPVYGTEGNHDLRHDSYQEFPDQPISVIYASGAIKQIRDEVFKNGDLSVRIRSFPFVESPVISEMPRCPKDTDLSICVLHIYASPSGGMFRKNKIYKYDELCELGDDIFVLGHYHLDHGIVEENFGGKIVRFINVGALSRGTLTEENIERVPKVAYVEMPKRNGIVSVVTKTIRLRVKPASEVFDLEAREREKERSQEAEAFVERLKMEDMGDNPLAHIESELSALTSDKEVLEATRSYLAEANTALNG